HVGLPKRRQVGSDEAEPVRELRDEIAEHVASGGKAVQQQNRWRVLRPSLAVEDLDAVDIDLPERNRAHGKLLSSIVNGSDGGYRRGLEKIRPRKGYPPRSPPRCFYYAAHGRRREASAT